MPGKIVDMAKWNEGDRVRVVERKVTEEDRKKGRYYEHMGGLVGTIQNIFSESEIAVRVDPETMSKVTADVHKTAMQRMYDKNINGLSEEQRKGLTKEELDFKAHYVLLVQSSDIEAA